jgi:hypothetical protein
MKLKLSMWLVLGCLAFSPAGQAQPVLKFDGAVIHLVGLRLGNAASTTSISDERWHAILSVFTQEAYLRNIDQPVAGKYSRNADTVVFEPTYPFAPGEIYHAVFRGKELWKSTGIKDDPTVDKLELSFYVPEEIYRTTEVESIYPQSPTLPENLLRMHIYFSAPMMPGEAYNHIRLIRENGTPVEKAFLIVDQELWDTDRKRFTLLFDPGRIKRDLKSNIDLGTPLHKGEKYHLVIDSAWRDVHGKALGRSVTKTFSVVSPERTKLSAGNWKVIAPMAGSPGHVVISFDRPIDHALALKYISVNSGTGVVSGLIQTVNDTTWKFTPEHPWLKGEYVITISPLLEDVAGNNWNNVFDLDLSKEERVNSVRPINIPFTVRDLAR